MERDFNAELTDSKGHKYNYDFDIDVMHRFMLESFIKYFVGRKEVLELGSSKGLFTERLLPYFDRIVGVEASKDAIEISRNSINCKDGKVDFIHGRFEDVRLHDKFDNIIMTHVLEHIDDRIGVLKRIHDEWLSDNGRFFLVCPNANAPSRQIAVHMGVLASNSAITPAEFDHGHRITYSLDTLESEAKMAGFRVIYRGGIFFKALANFQWDALLKTDIISDEYLTGCFKLGQKYPDLCSSIFILCEKGEG